MPTLTRDIPDHAAKRARLKKEARKAAKGRIFEDLTAEEKDTLLKDLLIRFGYIDDSD